MSNESIVTHCAPTMAGIKTASLFTGTFENKAALTEALTQLNTLFVPKGLCIICLRYRKGRALLYLFRPSQLKADMRDKLSETLLGELDYPVGDFPRCIKKLMARLNIEEGFPHEIGLFLGYPPEDVEGFITLGPKGAKFSGNWQVYGDVKKAEERFSALNSCTAAYISEYSREHDLEKLIKPS